MLAIRKTFLIVPEGGGEPIAFRDATVEDMLRQPQKIISHPDDPLRSIVPAATDEPAS